MGLDIFGLDILGLDILGLDILGTPIDHFFMFLVSCKSTRSALSFRQDCIMCINWSLRRLHNVH